MPRIKQLSGRYADEDFRKELRRQQGVYNLMSTRALGKDLGIPHSTLHRKIEEPEKFSVDDLRKLIAGLKLNPAVVLGLLGYKSKEIKKSLEEDQYEHEQWPVSGPQDG